jgi:predicted  nucleic acid-binding Zn-ribbon protein
MASSGPGENKPSRSHLNRKVRELRNLLAAEQSAHAKTTRKLHRAKKVSMEFFVYDKQIKQLRRDLVEAEETCRAYRSEIANLSLKYEVLRGKLNDEIGRRLELSRQRYSGR